MQSEEQANPIQRSETPVAAAVYPSETTTPGMSNANAREIDIKSQITPDAELVLPPTQQIEMNAIPVAALPPTPAQQTALPVADGVLI